MKTPEQIAEEICSVQPMPNDIFADLLKASKPEEELIAKGYESVCPSTRLLWIKKD